MAARGLSVIVSLLVEVADDPTEVIICLDYFHHLVVELFLALLLAGPLCEPSNEGEEDRNDEKPQDNES